MGLKWRRSKQGSAGSEETGSVSERGIAVPAKDKESRTESEAAFEELEVDDVPQVGIIMGSKNDEEVMTPACEELKEREIRYEVRVMSAHRDPDRVADYARNAHMRGLKVIIAGAGMAAALPGIVAAHTELPVIAVPIQGKSLGGLDALLSAVQMPSGVPVACMAINGARNAAILAARILAV